MFQNWLGLQYRVLQTGSLTSIFTSDIWVAYTVFFSGGREGLMRGLIQH